LSENSVTHITKACKKHHEAGPRMVPSRKEKIGHPRNSWQRDLEKEIQNVGLISLSELERGPRTECNGRKSWMAAGDNGPK